MYKESIETGRFSKYNEANWVYVSWANGIVLGVSEEIGEELHWQRVSESHDKEEMICN